MRARHTPTEADARSLQRDNLPYEMAGSIWDIRHAFQLCSGRGLRAEHNKDTTDTYFFPTLWCEENEEGDCGDN